MKLIIFLEKLFSGTSLNINLFFSCYLAFVLSRFCLFRVLIRTSYNFVCQKRYFKTVKLSRSTLLCYHFQWCRSCISRTETPVRQGEINKKTWNFGPENSYLQAVLCNFTRLCFDKTKVNIWSLKTSKAHAARFCSSYSLCSDNSSCLCSTLFHSAHFSHLGFLNSVDCVPCTTQYLRECVV